MSPDPGIPAPYDLLPAGLVTTDADGEILRTNRTFLEWTGLVEEEALGRRIVHLLDPGSRLFYENRFRPAVLLRGRVAEATLRLRRPDADPLAVMAGAAVERTPDGVLLHHVLLDASERFGYEEQLRRAREDAEAVRGRLSVLQDATTTLVACETEDELAAALMASARTAFRAPTALVELHDGDGASRLVGEQALARFLRPDPAEDQPEGPILVDTGGPVLPHLPLKAVSVVRLLQADRSVGTLVCGFQRHPDADDDFRALHFALGRIAAQAVGRLRLQKRLEALALQDPLTGLGNRAHLRAALAGALERVEATGIPCSLLLIDLDDFKGVNDTRGHEAGDVVLRTISERLRQVVRHDDLICRYGGDEFVIVSENATPDAARRIAERVLGAVEQPIAVDGATLRLTASIGVATAHERPVPTPRELFAAADQAMYAAKEGGRARLAVAGPTPAGP